MNTIIQAKRWAGRHLIDACEALPILKPALARWGRRTKKEWFAERVVHVQHEDGTAFRLASVSANYLSFELFWRGVGYYEPVTALLAEELVQLGDTFIDVGANVGFYSLLLSTRRRGLNVVAFEPNPKAYALLLQNISSNHLGNVVCEPVALSNREGNAQLSISSSDMSASLQADFDGHQVGTVPVQTTTLDNYLASRPVSGRCLIKVDVEGHEDAFYEGARRSLEVLQPDIITEVAMSYSPETSRLLQHAGYHFYQITNEGLIESPTLTPVIRGRFVFLNYLLSVQPPQVVARRFGQISDRVRRIRLEDTSKLLSPDALEAFKHRQALRELELQGREATRQPQKPDSLSVQGDLVRSEVRE